VLGVAKDGLAAALIEPIHRPASTSRYTARPAFTLVMGIMAKPFKIVLYVIGGLILLLVAAAVALPLLFDPNSFRGQISERVEEQTGRSFSVGDIQLRVFPWLRVAVADAVLGNAEGFGEAPFAEVRQLGVGVKLWPLLTERQVEVSSITLDGLRLRLAIDASGRSNWQDLIDRQEDEPEAEKPAGAAEGKAQFELVDVGGITISDALVEYRDAQAGQAYRLEPFNFKTGTITPGKPLDITTDLVAFSDAPKAELAVKLSTTVTPDTEAKTVLLEAIEATIKAKAEKAVDGQDANIELNLKGDARAKLEPLRIETGALSVTFNGKTSALSADGKLALKLIADLAEGVFDAQDLALDAKASGAAIPGGAQTLKLGGRAQFNQKTGAMRFDDGRIEAAGLIVTTTLRGEGLTGERPQLSGPIKVAPFSPRSLLKTLGIALETADEKALTTASLDARYSGSFSTATLDDLTMKLDDSTLSGRVAVTDFATQALQFALRLDAIDADRYLPPKPKEPAKPAGGGDDDINAIELPTEVLDALNANGTLDIGRLKINGLQMSDVRLKLSGSGNAPKTQEVTAKLYGGNVNLSNRYAGAGTPAFTLKTQLDALNAAPFLADFLGKDYVSGLGNLNLDLSSRGTTVGELRKTLNGSVAVKVENGAVKGFNLGQILRRGEAMLAGQAAPAETEPQETDFATITASATIVNGLLKTNDLAAASPLFRLAGSGEIDLARETIRFLAKPTVVETSRGQGGKGLDQLRGLTIPIEISGNLFSPKYRLGIEDALKSRARDAVKDRIAEELKLSPDQPAEEQIKQRLNEKLGDLLSGRRKRDEAPAAPATAPEATPAPTPDPTPAPEPSPAAAAPST
jgi:AsmA protein